MKPVTDISQIVHYFGTELLLGVGVVVLVLASLVGKFRQKRTEVFASTLILLGGALAAACVVGLQMNADPNLHGFLDLGNGNRVLWVDRTAIFFKILFTAIAFLAIVISVRSKELLSEHYAEFCALVLAVTLGMILMATSVDLLMIYLALEMVSILSYVMAGYTRGSIRSSEASLKYLLYGALASGTMIYGMSILYGYTGTLSLPGINAALSGSDVGGNPLIVLSVLFVLAGIGYKMAAVPFHFWCPDVYEGAPLPVTAFFSVGPKAAGFALAIRFFVTGFSEPYTMNGVPVVGLNTPELSVVGTIHWTTAIYVLSIATMTLGNLAALRQESTKRLLAYSSIAHAGYLLMGLTTLSATGVTSVLLYLVVYALMNLGAFAVVMMVSDERGSDNLEAFRGTFKDAPWVAVAMCIFLFSLTGLPPFAGFVGKWYLFSAVIDAAGRAGQSRLWVLAVAGVVNSAISLFYYVRVVRAMLAGSIEDEEAPEAGKTSPLSIPALAQVTLVLFVVPTVLFGLAFGWLKHLVDWTLTLTS